MECGVRSSLTGIRISGAWLGISSSYHCKKPIAKYNKLLPVSSMEFLASRINLIQRGSKILYGVVGLFVFCEERVIDLPSCTKVLTAVFGDILMICMVRAFSL